jgi:enamine deaminase RidA (YjgF/YER057c/UK114 family)
MRRHNPTPVVNSYETIYAHGVEVPSAARMLFISGQVGVDANGLLKEGGFGPQCRQAIANLESVLVSADMTLADVVKITVFVTDRSHLPALRDARLEHLAVAPAVTSFIVAGLHHPDWLVEIEAVAAQQS